MMQLSLYCVDDYVKWRLVKIRPAHLWASQGPWYWERRGEVKLEPEALSDREALTASLNAVLMRLGERKDLSGGGE